MKGDADLDVLVVCSSGGHLFDAIAISRAWEHRSRAWVSFDKADVRSLLGDERVYIARGPTNRNVPNLLRNFLVAWRVLGETRPRVLISTGAGVAVPFAWVARLRGTRVIYVECAGRVDRPSLSGRLIEPVACQVYAQWPELAASWPAARYAGNALLHARASPKTDRPPEGILVTVGTNEAPFDRLVRAATRLGQPGERVVVQHGASTERPARTECIGFLPFDELDRLTSSARAVVCHAGVGSVALALAHGLRPIVVPRLRRYGEAVDDHQVFFARRLEQAGIATVIDDVNRLPEAIAGQHSAERPQHGPDLGEQIGRELDRLL